MINDIPDRPLDPPEEPVAKEPDPDVEYDLNRQWKIDTAKEYMAKAEKHQSPEMRKLAKSITDGLIKELKSWGSGK